MTQIDTALDAYEFLTGKWATKPNADYTEAELDAMRTNDLIELARMWLADAAPAEQQREISLIPNWKAAAQIYIMALENGTSTGQQAGREGIMEMAQKFDAYIAQQKEAS